MRLHPNLHRAVIQALGTIFEQGELADKAVPNLLRSNRQWGSKDRRFLANSIYEIVRYKRLYAFAAGSASVDESTNWEKVFLAWAVDHEMDLPDWMGVTPDLIKKMNERLDQGRLHLAIRESVPDWIDELGSLELGDKWDSELHALNQPAQVVLRTNTLKTTPEKLQLALAKEQIETAPIPGYPLALAVQNRGRITQSKTFRQGWCEIQDPSSQAVGLLVGAEPGMKVVDACAGAGGKTLQIAAMMKNRGEIIAMDILSGKLQELRKRAQRNGVQIVKTEEASPELISRYRDWADVVLIDAPCSGSGTWRRKADAKWKLTREFLGQIQRTQAVLLEDNSTMVKPGGILVYATCSVFPSENHQQIRNFLESVPGGEFELEQERYLLPSECGFDGFYMARLKRK